MDLFCNPALWTSLYHAETAPFMVDFESFGWNQPSVRRSAWAMLQTLLQYWKGSMQRMLPLLSIAVLRSAWVEPDTTVRNVIWKPLLTFLKGTTFLNCDESRLIGSQSSLILGVSPENTNSTKLTPMVTMMTNLIQRTAEMMRWKRLFNRGRARHR